VKSQIVLLGLRSVGLELLASQLDVHYREIPEIREAWDGLPNEDASPSEPWISSRLAECIGEAGRGAVLLVYTSPAKFLAHRLKRAAERQLAPEYLEPVATESLAFWRAYHTAMLEQYRQHEDRALLLNGDHSIDVEALLARIKVLLGPGGSPERLTTSTANGARGDVPRASLFQVVDAVAPECLELYAELESCAELLGREPEFDFTGPEARQGHIRDLLHFLAQEARIEQLFAGIGVESDNSTAGLSILQSRLNESTVTADAREGEIAALRKRVSGLQRERDEARQQREQLSSQIAENEKESKSLQQEKDSLLLQVKKLQEESDEARQTYQQLSNKTSGTGKEKKAIQEENELLLHQLHQVQEELEHYYLLQQKTVQQQEVESQYPNATLSPTGQSPGNNGRDVQAMSLTEGVSVLKAAGSWFGMASNRNRTLRQNTELVRKSGYFDEVWYLEQYPDVAKAGVDPIEHYLRLGFSEGRNPGPRFDTRWYLESYPDVAQAGMNPLLHYIKFGRGEGRYPSAFGT
jgi:hypothetical protein